jgi:hypothetical protein
MAPSARQKVVDAMYIAHTGDQIHWNKNSTQSGKAREDVIDLIIGISHFDTDLCEVVGMRTGQQFLVVIERLRHGDKMVLNI